MEIHIENFNSQLFIMVLFLFIINIVGLLVMGVDKRRSKKGEFRVPEKRLFGIAAIGGALGILTGMYTFRHKTKHLSFRFGIPLLVVFNVVVLGYLSIKIGL